MSSNRSSIVDYFFNHNQMIIPVYQRNYSWYRDNCEQLLEDLISVIPTPGSEQNKKHFLGAVVYIAGKGERRFIIDGQQRVTTVGLFMIAMRDAIEDGILQDDEDRIDIILNMLRGKLRDMNRNWESTLIHVEKDRPDYDALIARRHIDVDHQSIMWNNYQLFSECICKRLSHTYKASQIMSGLNNLWIIPIELDSDEGDDPQAVFESINSTGLSLTDADRIRNYILMNRGQKDQEVVYRECWRNIEDVLGAEILPEFFRHYLTMKTSDAVTEGKVYSTFRRAFADISREPIDSDGTLQEIVRCAGIYGKLKSGDLTNISKEADFFMKRINWMGQTTVYPFLMNVILAHDRGEYDMTSDEVTKIVKIMDNFIIRRLACGYLMTGLNKIIPPMFKNVISLEGEAPFSEKLKYLIVKRSGTCEYPTDDTVRTKLAELELYRRENCNYIMSIMNYNNRDSSDVLYRINATDLTVDHIMPQTSNQSWKRELGPNHAEIYQKWLHKAGNLTLTAYNSNLSNKPYLEKRNNPEYGYAVSDLPINAYMKEVAVEHWSEADIEERNRIMVERFIKNRPALVTDFVPIRKDEMRFDLGYGNTEDLLKTKVYGYIYGDEGEVVFKDAYSVATDLLRKIAHLRPDGMAEIAADDTFGAPGSAYIKETNEDGCGEQLGPNLYVKMHMDNRSKFEMIRGVMKRLGLDPSEVTILYRNNKVGANKT